jgi:hypothetical protein
VSEDLLDAVEARTLPLMQQQLEDADALQGATGTTPIVALGSGDAQQAKLDNTPIPTSAAEPLAGALPGAALLGSLPEGAASSVTSGEMILVLLGLCRWVGGDEGEIVASARSIHASCTRMGVD